MIIDLQPFWEVGLATQVHAVAAILAFLIGCYIFLRRKGSSLHKTLGKIWVALMAIVAFSSLFIHGLKTWGLFSPLHLLSLFTFASLIYSIWSIRKKRVKAHQGSMLGLFIGGLVIAGALAFSRGLLMHDIFLAQSSFSVLPTPSQWPGGIFGSVFGLFFLVFLGVVATNRFLRFQK